MVLRGQHWQVELALADQADMQCSGEALIEANWAEAKRWWAERKLNDNARRRERRSIG